MEAPIIKKHSKKKKGKVVNPGIGCLENDSVINILVKLVKYSACLHQPKWKKADEGGGNKWHALSISKENDRSS